MFFFVAAAFHLQQRLMNVQQRLPKGNKLLPRRRVARIALIGIRILRQSHLFHSQEDCLDVPKSYSDAVSFERTTNSFLIPATLGTAVTRAPAAFLSERDSTDPSRATLPFFTMM